MKKSMFIIKPLQLKLITIVEHNIYENVRATKNIYIKSVSFQMLSRHEMQLLA